MKIKGKFLKIFLVIFSLTIGATLLNSQYLMGRMEANKDINRLQLAKILTDAIVPGENLNQFRNCYQNIAGEWYEGRVCFLVSEGIYDNLPKNFMPFATVRRSEAAKIFVSAYESRGLVLPNPMAAPYTDVPVHLWFFQPISLAASLGIPEIPGGLGYRFRPDDNLTLKESVTWINGLVNAIEDN